MYQGAGSGHQEIRQLTTPQCWLCKYHPKLIYCSVDQTCKANPFLADSLPQAQDHSEYHILSLFWSAWHLDNTLVLLDPYRE